MALTKVGRGLLNTSIVDNGNATAITIDASKNVGIGRTSNIDYLLDVQKSADAYIRISSATTQENAGIILANQNGTKWIIEKDGPSHDLFVKSASVTAMTISQAGNLLVGTTTTNIATEGTVIYGSGNEGVMQLSSTNMTALYVNRSNSGELVQFRTGGSTVIGSIGVAASNYLAIGNNNTSIQFYANGIAPAAGSPSTLSDNSKDIGAAGFRFKDLHLSTNIHQGATTPSSSAAGVLNEAVGRVTYSRGSGTGGFGHVTFINGNGTVGSITTASSLTSYNQNSDYRLKEDAVPMTGATERVKALRPINFAWKVDGSRLDGFFAHEAQEVVPEAVHGSKDAMRDEEYEVTPAVEEVRDEDGNVTTEAVEAVMGTRSVPDMQGIDQSKLVPLLTATIQELIARIEALEGA